MTTVGMLYPGHSAEDDYPYLESVLGGEVHLPVVHTSVGVDAHEVAALLDLGSKERMMEGAREVLGSSPQSVMWACTSGSFVFGWEGARQQAKEIEDVVQVPAASTSMAFAAALEHLGVHQVAVCATYPKEVAQHFVSFLSRSGTQVLELQSHGIPTARQAGALERPDILSLARGGDTAAAQAVLLPDTALHTARWLTELETLLGKPVLTANQVTAWHGLRLAGDPILSDGLGLLFRS